MIPLRGLRWSTGIKGIGAEAAARLARDGFTVIVNYVRDALAAAAHVARLHEVGGRAIAIQADVSDPSAVCALLDSAANLGSVDVLVNNAGVQMLATLAEMPDKGFDSLANVNLRGPFNMMREAAHRMKEMRGRDITVNAIAPGPVSTELVLKGRSMEQLDHVAKQSHLERPGEPSDIASTNLLSGWPGGPLGQWPNPLRQRRLHLITRRRHLSTTLRGPHHVSTLHF